MYTSIELVLWGRCTLKCKYCYVHPHLENFLSTKENWCHRVEGLFDFLNKQKASTIELFGGDILDRDVGIDIVEMLLSETEFTVVLPTNGTWVLKDSKFNRILKLLEKYGGSRLGLSFSTDGFYGDSSRWIGRKPPVEYYTKMFDIASKYCFGFHPMIHSSNIDTWKENFDWFLDMYKRYKLPLRTLYLLEVRNHDWTPVECQKLYDFMIFIMERLHSVFGDGLAEFIKEDGMNILRSPLITTAKGLGCSMPTTLSIRVADYAIPICHRLMYDQFIVGHINTSTNEIDWIDKKFYEFIKYFDYKEQPVCKICMLKHVCSLGCLGAQFECTRDIFMPIPTVCMMEHFKVAGIIEGYMKTGVFIELTKNSNDVNINSILNLKEMLDGLSKH